MVRQNTETAVGAPVVQDSFLVSYDRAVSVPEWGVGVLEERHQVCQKRRTGF